MLCDKTLQEKHAEVLWVGSEALSRCEAWGDGGVGAAAWHVWNCCAIRGSCAGKDVFGTSSVMGTSSLNCERPLIPD